MPTFSCDGELYPPHAKGRTMIDPTTETVFSLTEATEAKHGLPRRRQGKRPHVSCLYRWTTTGCRGIVLESIQIGGTRCTSREALARFFARLTQADGQQPQATRTTAQRQRDQARAEAILDAEGI